MKTVERVAGIIIKDGKLLFVKGKGVSVLWTPGGRIEPGESDEECLRRELKEEIKVELESMEHFGDYTRKSTHFDHLSKNKVYLATVRGVPEPDNEIESLVWVSLEDFENRRHNFMPVQEKELIPDLIKKGIFGSKKHSSE